MKAARKMNHCLSEDDRRLQLAANAGPHFRVHLNLIPEELIILQEIIFDNNTNGWVCLEIGCRSQKFECLFDRSIQFWTIASWDEIRLEIVEAPKQIIVDLIEFWVVAHNVQGVQRNALFPGHVLKITVSRV